MFSRAINIAEVENCFAKAAAGGTAYRLPCPRAPGLPALGRLICT